MRDTLTVLGERLQSSKFTGHSYLPVYDELFAPWRDQPIHLLELGVGDGNSMHLWLQYFTEAMIHGVDASLFTTFGHPRMRTYACDVSDPRLGTLFPPDSLDIIIDDASHRTSDQRLAYLSLWPCLKKGGLYLIEDVYLTPENGGVNECLGWWQHVSGFQVIANFKTMYGEFRNDDVLVILRK